jgi:DNA-binding HxlR family transcriptional regulator
MEEDKCEAKQCRSRVETPGKRIRKRAGARATTVRKRCSGKKAVANPTTEAAERKPVDPKSLAELNRLLKNLSHKELTDHANEMIERLSLNAANGNVTSFRLLYQLAEQHEELEGMSQEDCDTLLDKQIAIGMQSGQDSEETEQERDKA